MKILLQGSTDLPLHSALMINTDNVLISNQEGCSCHMHYILPVYVGLPVLIEFPIPVTLISMVELVIFQSPLLGQVLVSLLACCLYLDGFSTKVMQKFQLFWSIL